MARDRTSEFMSTIKSMQGKPQWMDNELRSRRGNSKWQTNGLNGHVASPYNSYVAFMRGSRSVARDLCATYQKLEKINELARKKTLFDGDEASQELNQLVFIVRQDITSLNQQIEALRQQQLQSMPQKNNSNIETHSKNVVLTLQHQLASMSSNFKNTLELRTQNMQQQKMRREQFTCSSTSANSTLIDMSDDENAYLQRNQKSPEQQQLLIYEDQSTAYLEDRASTMQYIESTIVELGTIFNQLASIVQQQEEMILRIDSNVNDTVMNVESAHESLLRYFASVSNNRWLIIKVFGVLFFFFVIFVLFAA